MTPPEKVIVVLDRAEAEEFVAPGNEGSTAASKPMRELTRAALDRDPDELVERVAKAIWEGSDLNDGEEQSWDEFKAKWPYDVDSLEIMSRAAIAAIEGEGETNG